MTKPAQIIAKETRYLYLLIALCVALFATYMYLVSASVVHVVERKESMRNSTELQSEIAKLEAKYIALQHTISEDLALQSGFVPVADKVFLHRNDTVALLYNGQ